MIRPLTVEDVDFVLDQISARSSCEALILTGASRERMASCLDHAFGAYADWQLPQIERTAAMLYWRIITECPLANGNKRVAVAATELFMALNGYESRWAPGDLHRAATLPVSNRDGTHQKLEDLALFIFSNAWPRIA